MKSHKDANFLLKPYAKFKNLKTPQTHFPQNRKFKQNNALTITVLRKIQLLWTPTWRDKYLLMNFF